MCSTTENYKYLNVTKIKELQRKKNIKKVLWIIIGDFDNLVHK